MKKLLIVDDSAVLLEIMKSLLEGLGYAVRTLPGADKLYETIMQYRPHLLILDILLGTDDGRDICRKLRKDVSTRDMSVLVFSASPKYLENYRRYGANDYMEKPFDIKELVEKIRFLLELPSGEEIPS